MERDSVVQNLALEFVQVTEAAAIAAAGWIGKGDPKAADGAAVTAMRERFKKIDFCGEVVIGEGAKDEAPELFVGETLGCGAALKDEGVDIAVDPLECTNSVAFGRPNAISVIAAGPRGSLYRAADSYMEKIAVGNAAAEVIDLDAPVEDTVYKVAHALGKDTSEVTVAVLDRPRHETLIQEIRRTGARIALFTDGDVAMAIAAALDDSSIDLLMGIGGSTEAVLAAAALSALEGQILCRWKPKDEKHILRLRQAGVTDFNQILTRNDLVRSNEVTFTATGIVSGPLLTGVVVKNKQITTHSLIMTAHPRTMRFIETHHFFSHMV